MLIMMLVAEAFSPRPTTTMMDLILTRLLLTEWWNSTDQEWMPPFVNWHLIHVVDSSRGEEEEEEEDSIITSPLVPRVDIPHW